MMKHHDDHHQGRALGPESNHHQPRDSPYCPKSRPSGYSRLAGYFTPLARSNSASDRAMDADGFRRAISTNILDVAREFSFI